MIGKIQIEGLDKLLSRLKRVKGSIANRILRKAIGKANLVLKREIKNKAPKDGGSLRKSLGAKVKIFKATNSAVGVVGVRSKWTQELNGRKHKPANYDHIVEGGRTAVTVKSKRVLSSGSKVYGKSVRAFPGKPFVEPALRSASGKVRQTLTNVIQEELDKL